MNVVDFILFANIIVLARGLPKEMIEQSFLNQAFMLAYKRKAWNKYLPIFI